METKKTLLTIALCALVATLCPPAQAKIIYVDDDAPAGGDGASWTTAYTVLQDALSEAAATAEPVEIRIAQGTYQPDRDAANSGGTGDREASFALTSNLTLAGGYAGVGAAAPNARDIQAYETILSGDLAGDDVAVADPCDLKYESSRAENSYNILTNERDALAIRLHGLTVSGGYANGWQRDEVPTTAKGGGFHARYITGLVIDRCVFEGNAGSWGAGGAELARCTDATIAESRFVGNMSVMAGGGIAITNNSGVTLIDCEIRGNYVRTCGGGLYAKSSDTVVSRCVLQGNVTSSYGGAAYVEGGNPAFVDCLFAENMADLGGGGRMPVLECAPLRTARFIEIEGVRMVEAFALAIRAM
jgi:hypothetical protein